MRYMKYLLILIVFLLGGFFNTGNFTKTIEKEAVTLTELYFTEKGELVQHSQLDVSLGQVELIIKTDKSEYFVIAQVSNYWVIGTILSYFIKPKVSIQSIHERISELTR